MPREVNVEAFIMCLQSVLFLREPKALPSSSLSTRSSPIGTKSGNPSPLVDLVAI
jgi:hypothetical protein